MGRTERSSRVNRREFLQTMSMVGCVSLITNPLEAMAEATELVIAERIGKLQMQAGKTPIPGASWFTAEAVGDGLSYHFPPGYFLQAKFLTSDMLVDGNDLLVFGLALQEGEHGGTFRLTFGILPQCSARFRFDLDRVDQRRWMLDREGAFLKPLCWGYPVDLAKVDRLQLTVASKHNESVRWCMTPLSIAPKDLSTITHPVLPKGKLLDEFGQSALRTWSSKAQNANEVNTRIRSQWENVSKQVRPEDLSRWGGWRSKKLIDGQGFFRTHNDGKRWWLVDPDGYAFWSAGADCVTVDQTHAHADGLESALSWIPDPSGEFRDTYMRIVGDDGVESGINYLVANLIRALGADRWRDKWAKMTISEMKSVRFNTVGNWSEWTYAKAAGFPYVRPLDFNAKRSGWIYREFPDVFHPEFETDAAEFAGTLSNTVNDPAFIGYFLMNEPTWGGFSSLLPAAGMLQSTESCFTRGELSRFLRKKYSDDAEFSAHWKMPVTFVQVESGKWQGPFSDESQDDLRDFSTLMTERYFKLLSAACRKADPNHLNLGARYNTVPPPWAVAGMKSFDVFSMNCYAKQVPHNAFQQISRILGIPVMIGEFGFGALDVGLPGTGPAPRLRNQLDRGKAYRAFLEDAVADPLCVGAHWFQLYDQSALGRTDGECYNLGFFDVCNQLYAEMGRAARASHERLYQVADGQTKAFGDAPEYLQLASM